MNRKLILSANLLLVLSLLLSACAAPQPQVIEKPVTVVVEVEKEKVVEKEKIVEVLVTPEPPPALAGRTNIIVANATDVSTLDPFQMFSRYEGSVSDHVIQYLTFRAADMSIVPQLATEWTRLEGDLVWEVKLREGVTFSNGEPFNAAAAKFSLDTLVQRYAEGKPLGHSTIAMPSAEVTGVEIVDDYTIRITTASPKALLPFYLSQMPMLAPGFYGSATDEQRASEMVGTGPYVLYERVRDSHVTLRINPNYWGEKPAVEEITFRVIPEIGTQIAELETGGVDIISGLPLDLAQILEGTPGIRVSTIEGGRRVLVGITTQGRAKALEDKRVRQALNYAIDWDAINEGLFMGRAKRMSYVFNPPYANTDVQPYPYDPEKARQLLAEAGYPDGLELGPFITPVGRWIKDYEIARTVKAQLEAVGVKFNGGLVAYEWGAYREKLLAHDLSDLFMQASGGEFEAAGEAADLTITSPSDFYEWNNPEYEALWQELQGELDMDRRYEIAMKMQEIIHDDAPWIFLYIQLDTYGVSERIDWQPRMDELIHLWDVNIVQ